MLANDRKVGKLTLL